MNNFFKVTNQDTNSKARSGILKTPHGNLATPAFIFCGTKATVKSVLPSSLIEANTQIILSNTYHLMLQPGSEIIAKSGGLQKFTNWNGPMMTDSGGYQIFSLGHGSVSDEIKGKNLTGRNKSLLKITEEGASFKNYLNGNKILLTPEKSIDIQRDLGADLIFVLDECTPFNVDKNYTEKSMHMTHRWAKRCLENFKLDNSKYIAKNGSAGEQRLYGIIQGGVYEDLRKRACEEICSINFDGLAIGGSLGGTKEQMYEVFDFCSLSIDSLRPVHVLGIGGLDDILEGVSRGFDTFDCVSPTRIARHGVMLSKYNKKGINLNNSAYKNDDSPLDKSSAISLGKEYSKAYVHHLFKSNEILGMTILSIYNIWFMNNFLSEIRKSINENNFNKYKSNLLFNFN
ncbi:tRNA guanosine(34) transglycosylase Tgt [Alphaproteobacteria bacterium]|nr:tRNA guanosine(34) transglycosylase Tgt [Alphaproteobacteria bacterium]